MRCWILNEIYETRRHISVDVPNCAKYASITTTQVSTAPNLVSLMIDLTAFEWQLRQYITASCISQPNMNGRLPGFAQKWTLPLLSLKVNYDYMIGHARYSELLSGVWDM